MTNCGLHLSECCDIIALPGLGNGGKSRWDTRLTQSYSIAQTVMPKYKLVRAEADHAASYGQIECYHCGGPLSGREGQFILKYLLVDRPRRQLKPSRVK
jgi:hypothetical protein